LKLLIIEDEQGLRENIAAYFNDDGNICENCSDLTSAIDKGTDISLGTNKILPVFYKIKKPE
jgi:DNA-binding response OmpR family regulator